MNPRTTWLLLAVALGLGAFVYFYEIEGEGGRLESEEREKRLFADVEPEAIDWIALTTTDDVAARFEQSEGAWRLVEPVVQKADAAVGRIAEALATITHEAVLASPGPDAEYGLDDAAARIVRFGSGDAEHVLRLGRDTPVGSNVYAKTEGDAAIYTVASFRKNAFDRSLADLRDKQILSFDPTTMREVEARWPDGHVVLEGLPGAAAEADEGDAAELPQPKAWRMTVPVEAPGDGDAIERLLSTLAYLRADAFLDAPSGDETALLDPPAFSVILHREGEQKPLRLAIGRVGADDRRPIRVGEGPPRFWVGADRLDDFPRTSGAYRDRTLVALDTSAVRQLDFYFRSSVGASVALHASRDGEGAWTSEPVPFAEGMLSRIVSELADLEADDVLAESMGPDELEGVGLAPPHTVLTVLGAVPEASEPSDGALPPEPPVLAELEIGDVTASGIVARRAGEDTVYRLGIDVAERLPVSYEAFESRFRASKLDEATPPGADAGDEWLDPGEESP